MEKFIIKVEMKVDGEMKTLYHQDITNQTNKSVMNVYVEHLTGNKKQAKKFFDRDEAVRTAKFFGELFDQRTIIKL